MFRHLTAAAALASATLASATLLAAPVAFASPSASPSASLRATVVSSGPEGQRIKLSDDAEKAGGLNITRCAEASVTAFVCTGMGTIQGLGPAHVRIRWSCPAGKSCAGKGEGLLKNNGSTLALLHVKASVPKFQREGATFTIEVEQTPE